MLYPTAPRLRWEIFCRVVDNFGDIGVCWRLATQLAQRGQTVRLWVDDTQALSWMAPHGAPGVELQAWCPGTQAKAERVGGILVEAFGCEIDPEFVASFADWIRFNDQDCHWINLEYLSAETYVQRCHALPSPVMHGPGAGLVKHFFYPGFTTGTGGLLREADLRERQARFDRNAWLAQTGVMFPARPDPETPVQRPRCVSLFCYEPAAIGPLLDGLAQDSTPTQLLVTAGRSTIAVQREILQKNAFQPNWNINRMLTISYLPWLSQQDFDHLLWSCDLNFVRGEDSLVRAIWAGRAFVWQIYPQDDAAHIDKLAAFLDWLDAPASLRHYTQIWNAPTSVLPSPGSIPLNELRPWQQCSQDACARLWPQKDLVTQLLEFVSKTN
ncbi:MAG: elongation factor P maturation arginine rhamnosyltransferase EarP [Rhodoferax sp.]|uniref:elongation factor P maturation arginine rhamnosyltransferase EarP n=1 Tax=Rhodoferax sp. TaxID=50421 RepID=UPI001B64009E|nr:elongation factor P maturation arginine rhamnosyltransferase EarP [Rhodoferax sp.]MBP9905638.1 elongation factor P maturation arginine rhamnosyltransferase EarP [Rhodoferax sp.]